MKELDQASLYSLAQRIDQLFSMIKESNGNISQELNARMEYNLQTLFRLKREDKQVLYKSTGYSQGSYLFNNTRISEAKNEEEAKDAVNIYNHCLRNPRLELTVFHTNIGRYILSENFEGERITRASYEVYRKHIRNVIDITENSSTPHPFEIIEEIQYKKENYPEKLRQNIQTLKNAYPDLDNNVVQEQLEEGEKLGREMKNLPLEPAWDIGWKKNSKFRKGVIKYFDLKKATKLLRVKTYDTIQAIYGYGGNIEESKQLARETYNKYDKETKYLWDRNIHYYLTRRMHHTSRRHLLNHLVRLYLKENFETLEPARGLQKGLKNI